MLITGAGPAGMFYGTQTLLGLLPPAVFSPTKVQEPVAWSIPAIRIKDQPRFRCGLAGDNRSAHPGTIEVDASMVGSVATERRCP